MSKKLKWFLAAIACACFAVETYSYQAYDPMKAFIAAGVLCLIVWLYKIIRDKRLKASPPPIQEQSQARSSANNRLFVPPARYK